MSGLRLGGRCQRHPLYILPCAKCAVEKPQALTLRDVLRLLHQFIGDGTQKAAAERMGVSQQYLSDVLNENREPGALILDALGLERVVSYRVAHGAPEPDDTAGVATRHPRCGYPYCACVGECFAASQPGVTAGVEGTKNG